MTVRFIIVSLLIICLVSCEPHVNLTIGDGGLLSDQLCGPPCFWDITPGITRESQVWDILKNRKVSQSCNLWDSTSESGTRGIQCQFPGAGLKGSLAVISIGLETGSDATRFVGFTPSVVIKLQDVIQKYGMPTWIGVWSEGTPEHLGVSVTIFYDTISARLDFPQQDGTIYELQPDTMISSVSYLSSQKYVDFIKTINKNLQKWQSYGKYH